MERRSSHGRLASPTGLVAPSMVNSEQQQRLCSRDLVEKLEANHVAQGTKALRVPTCTADVQSGPIKLEHNQKIAKATSSGVPIYWPQELVRSAYFFSWSSSMCRCVLRIGPVTVVRTALEHESDSIKPHHHQSGVGIMFSFTWPKSCRRRVDFTLLLTRILITSRYRISLSWDLDFPRVVHHESRIFECARAGSIQDMMQLLSSGRATARDVTKFGITLLHIVSKSKSENIEMVQLLIQQGAGVNAQDEDGETPLHGAMARKGNYNIVKLLVEHGADLSNKATDGKTPLHTMFNDTVGMILSKEGWIEEVLPDSEGMSLCHYLVWSNRSTPSLFQKACMYDIADRWSVDGLGRNCLLFVAWKANLPMLSYLLGYASPVDIDRRDHQGRTPLFYAVRSNRAEEVVTLLVSKGCYVYNVDDFGQTMLHRSAQSGDLGLSKKFAAFDHKAKLLSPDRYGKFPSDLVDRGERSELYQFLKGLKIAADVKGRSTFHCYRPKQKQSMGTINVPAKFSTAVFIVCLALFLAYV